MEKDWSNIIESYGIIETNLTVLLEDYNEELNACYRKMRENFINGNVSSAESRIIGSLIHEVLKDEDHVKYYGITPKPIKLVEELNIDIIKATLDKLIKKYSIEYRYCVDTNTVMKQDNWQEHRKKFQKYPAICWGKEKIIVFDNIVGEWNWTRVDYIKEDYLTQISKYRKRKELGLDV